MTKGQALAIGAVVLTAAFLSSTVIFAEDLVGAPIVLKRGVSRTIDEIMASDRLLPPFYLRQPRAIEQELSVEPELAEDPNAPPPLSHWPPIAESLLGVTSSVGPPNLPQTVGTSFKAMSYSEGFWYPPDSMGDVGPTQILVHVNGRIKAFDKTGTLGPLNADNYAFWAPVLSSNYPGDPMVRYDRLSGRWFVLSTDFGSANNQLMIAVSSGPTITGSGSFTFYAFHIGSVLPQDGGLICDYPSLGVDANALYVGCNMFDASFSSYQYSSAYVIRKSSVVSGGPMVVTGFSGIAAVGLAGPSSPRGVDNDDPNWNEGYFIGTDPGGLGRIDIRRISDPGGTPTLGATVILPVSSTNLLDQAALGSGLAIAPATLRLFAASMRKNKLTGETSLWTAHSVETDTTCTPQNSGNSRRLGAKWYEIGNMAGTPTITQFGTLCSTAAGSATSNTQRGFLFPTVIANGQGHVALAASYASETEFVGIAAAGRLRTDPLGGTRAPETIVLTGLASYDIRDGVPRNRWGDYSFTDVDPTDDQTIWTFQEYADTPANNWSVRVVQLKAPPPPTTATAGGPVCNGVAAAPVSLTGTDSCAAPVCTNGLCTGGGACPEFFDPGPDTGGPGYLKHLTATVSGGVTVNSANIAIPANPATQRVRSVVLSLNTTATTTGVKNVTIVNPDGQTRVYNAVINVIANRLPVANAGGPYSVCLGDSANLNGAASTDPDALCGDSLVSYGWDLNGDTVIDVTGATPTVTPAQLTALGLGVGPHTITVKVTDSNGATNTASGTLTILADASGCSDGNVCTQTDTCQAGTCVGANPVTCSASDQCHTVGVCNAGTGVCSNPNASDGTPCNDANACTLGDICGGGVCNSGTAITAPPETHDVIVAADKATYVWSAATYAATYDVVRGSLSGLPVGPGGGDEIGFEDLADPTLSDATVPAPGAGFWYLSRGENACGNGTYGTQSNGSSRTTTTTSPMVAFTPDTAIPAAGSVTLLLGLTSDPSVKAASR